MSVRAQGWACLLTLVLLVCAPPAPAQDAPPEATPGPMPGMAHPARVGHRKHPPGAMKMPGMHPETGLLGPYPMSRDASGTSWQPDASVHRGPHSIEGDWTLMAHGFADVVRDHQGGPRGADKVYSDNMLMALVRHSAEDETIALRAMLSAETSTIGRGGYPLLLQTGETADGRTPLVDRQHPHDLPMELALLWNRTIENESVFFYAGVPGEPALGPPTFMHRFSGAALPMAPITHHWLDSTHITWGVLTAGGIVNDIKLEASWFRGREPDQNRTDFERAKFDSHAFRLSFNPSPEWALQASHGRLKNPDQLLPGVGIDRTTASVMRAGTWPGGAWGLTFAWGRNHDRPGHTLDGYLLEATTEMDSRHVVFARAERVKKDGLFTTGPLAGQALEVGEVSGGYRVDLLRREHWVAGIGAMASITYVPPAAEHDYGKGPRSGLAWLHVELR